MNNPSGNGALSIRQRVLPILIALLGAGVIASALAGDVAAMGAAQMVIAGAGAALVILGIALNIPAVVHKITGTAGKLTGQADARPQLVEILLIGIWFGLITGLGEAIFQTIRALTIREIDSSVAISIDVLWMAPLVDAAIFAVISLVVMLVAWSWPELISFGTAIFIFALLAFRTLLQLIPGLDDIAVLVLAAGLAVQVARLMKSRRSRLYALIWRTGGWLGLLRRPTGSSAASRQPSTDLPSRRDFIVSSGATVAGLALGVAGGKAINEQTKLGALPPAQPNMPNVLLIVLDTVRSHNCSVYGYERLTTPNLERFAERSVRFQRAITSAPWTLPAHTTMFTGRWHHEFTANWNIPLDNTYPTLAEVLSQHGYLTAGFVANLDFCSTHFGLNRGFLHYEDLPISLGQAVLSTSIGREVSNRSLVRETLGFYDLLNRKDAAVITDEFLNWLPDQSDRPFFAFLNYYDAHQLYLPPAPYDTMFGPKRTRNQFRYFSTSAEVEEMWTMSPEEVQEELDAYDGAIAYTDAQLGRLIDELANRGVLDNTLVIITGDHGEQFGEHELFGHTNSVYIQTVQVPLLMSLPSRIPAGIDVPGSASQRDFPATILDVIGLETDVQFPGESLARHWQDTPANAEPVPNVIFSEIRVGVGGVQEWYPLAKGDINSIVVEQYHYIREADGREQLFDLDNDPLEEQDLAGLEDHSAVLADLRAAMDNALSTAEA